MSVNSTGFGNPSAQSAIQNVIAGGATIYLIPDTTSVAVGDAVSDISSASVQSKNVAEADFTINGKADFTDTSDLNLSAEVSIDVSGTSDTIDTVVIANQSAEEWILSDETNNPDLSQIDTLTLSSGDTLYSVGNA